MTNLLARAFEGTQDPYDAILLVRIAFRYNQARKAGKKSTAQSYSDLVSETGFKPRRIKKSLSNLRQLGLIQSKQGLFGNKNVNHIWLTEKGSRLVEGHSSSTQKCLPEGSQISPLYIQGETTGSDNMEISVQLHAGSKAGSFASPGKGASMIRLPPKGKRTKMNAGASEAKPAKPTSVLDVVAHVKANKMLHHPDSATGLSFLWKQLVFEHHGSVSTVTTKKELGQFKNFINKCPPGTAIKAMTVALVDWVKFAKTVEEQAGIKNSPSMPNLDFLLKHAGVAVNLIAKSPKSPSKQEAGTGMISSKDVQLISQTKPKADKPAAEVDDAMPSSLDDLIKAINGGGL